MKIAFVKPPFYRLAGSHSNKVSVDLSYYRGIAVNSGHETMMYNGDQTGSEGYWSWRTLMQNTDMYKSMIDLGTNNPMLHEIAEAVMAWEPDVVFISSYDIFQPSVALDSPYTCGFMAEIFERLGVPTVGVGVFFPHDKLLRDKVRVAIKGGPSPKGFQDALRMIKFGGMGSLVVDVKWDTSIMPHIYDVKPYPDLADYSYVATTKGCNFPCKFCYNTIAANVFEERPLDQVVVDILLRMELMRDKHPHLYFTDQIFTRNSKRLELLLEHLRSSSISVTFTVEARTALA